MADKKTIRHTNPPARQSRLVRHRLAEPGAIIYYPEAEIETHSRGGRFRMEWFLPLLLLSTFCFADDEKLIAAIAKVESNNNPSAVGDEGRAVGLLQIHPIVIKDVNRILGKELYSLSDRLDPEKSKEMFRIYTNYYSKGLSDEIKSRRWNGGPSGEKKKATAGYWNKVKSALNEYE